MTRRAVHVVRLAVGAGVGAVVVAACWTSSFLDQGGHRWAIVAIIVTAMAVADCLPDLEAALPWPGAVTIALLFPLAAIYGCVPETDHLYTIGAVLGTVGVLEIVMRRARGIVWHALAATLVLWGAVYGATGRDRAFVGGLFAFWPIVLVAVVGRLLPRLGRVAPARVLVFILGAVAALVVARTGALETGRRAAGRDAALAGSASLILALIVALIATRARRSRPTS